MSGERHGELGVDAAGRGAAIAIAFAVLSVTRSARASPEDLFGYGMRTSAMGATGAAHARGYETAWSNPALASMSRTPALTLGVLAANPRLDANGAGHRGRTPTDPVRGILIGAELPVPLGGPLARRVGLAFGFYTPTQVIARGRVLYPEKTQFPVLADRGQSLAVRIGLGADLGYGLRAGVGVAALAELTGRVVAATDATGRVGTSVETQLVATYAPAAGLSWETVRRDETYRLGLVVRGQLDARFGVVIDGTKLSTLPIPLFDISGVAQYDPAQLAIEAAREDEVSTLAVQIVGKRWSAFPGVMSPTVVCSDGSPGGCGLSPPAIDWKDTVAIRAGAERRLPLTRHASFAARAGVSFETSPLADTLPTSEAYAREVAGPVSVPTAYLDASRVATTLGAGVVVARPLPFSVDLLVGLQTLLPRTIRSVDGAGATRLEGEAAGTIGLAGLSTTVRF